MVSLLTILQTNLDNRFEKNNKTRLQLFPLSQEVASSRIVSQSFSEPKNLRIPEVCGYGPPPKLYLREISRRVKVYKVNGQQELVAVRVTRRNETHY